MTVDEKLIDHLANLARLEFDPAAKQAMQADMEKIIGFVEKLNELDTTGVDPLRFMGKAANVYREDMPGKNLPVAKALQNAPHKDESFFKVPKVIKRD
jgi:aspartyl-tRNA(Asn)/glutamyl-tRNA(Gln) amidotransferase subunit C